MVWVREMVGLRGINSYMMGIEGFIVGVKVRVSWGLGLG